MASVPRLRRVVLVLLSLTLLSIPGWATNLQILTVGESDPVAEIKGSPVSPVGVDPRGLIRLPESFGQGFASEVEPNDTSATATPLGGSTAVVNANIFPNGDLDYFSFTASAGDRVYAAVMTAFSANGSSDSQLDVLDVDGLTSLEFDDDNGTFGGLASTISGTTIPADGTYFLRVRHFSATNQLRPYHLHFRLHSGTPVPETEPDNNNLPGEPLPASGWVSGETSSVVDVDLWAVTLNAGDTVFLSLDMDPERDTVEWNGTVGLGAFNGFFLVANDGGAAGPDSEVFYVTVRTAGIYSIVVTPPIGGATFGTYHLSATIIPNAPETANCTTYTSTNVPQAIPDGPGMVSSTLTVPGNPRIADLDVAIDLIHANMPDLDVHLISPAGNDNGLFSDIGTPAQQLMGMGLDDEAGYQIGAFAVVTGMVHKPELAYRLSWFDGEDAGGTWTLQIRDDAAGNGGMLSSWSLTICEPPPPPDCPPGHVLETVYSSDFEADDGGFTHSGTADEWERGLPTFDPITTCNSGTNCWVTDLDNTYNPDSDFDLLSPPIDLTGHAPPVVVSWAQRYQMESASFDNYSVDVQEMGGANPARLFEWLDATMTDTVGNPPVTINESAGWGVFERQIDDYAGLTAELQFHLNSDESVQFAGVAIDDVEVTACRLLESDLSITKTDGVATAVPGMSVTYTITAANAGPDPVVGGNVTDTFPGVLTCTWTCVGAGGGTCTANGSGNINDTVDLPLGGSVTYTANCAIAASATGTLVNTATVSSAMGDPNPANNSATDTDTLTPMADLAITKTDGVTTAVPGESTTYTITAVNGGPSNAPGSTVADTFPASLSCTWTCIGAGGGTCPGAGAGNINSVVNLPAGGSVTYTASCDISAAATGTLVNTATVAAGAGVTDPNAGNNSATDTDTLTPQANLSITKTDGLTTASTGQASTYTIVVSNPGPSNVIGATVADTFPANFTGATWTCSGAGGGTCTANGAGNINDVVNLPSGGSVTYVVNGTIGDTTGDLSNTATVTAPGGVTDPEPANNSATDTTTIVAGPSVSATKTVSGVLNEGGAIVYTVVLTNNGAVAQGDNPGDEFTDTLPPQLTLTGATASSGTVTTAGNTVTWNGSIAPAGTVTIEIDATINGGTEGETISNQGTVNFDSDGDGTNDMTAPTDDPEMPGDGNSTDFVAGPAIGDDPNVLEIPTLSWPGMALLILFLASAALYLERRRLRG